MSSWVQLLALLAACLRFGATEGDPLPAALVELVRSSPIASIEDLHLLLLTDSVDEELEGSPANGGHRLPRSLDAQPAQQALCKVRTEVVEVTRAMLDRSNANFLLWPPCVEVQRCSGCCNTKSLQCVPVLTHTRYLQVMKIQYVNKRPTYAKAVVSVVDHVECRCQPAPRPPASKKRSSSRRQQNHHKDQHGNQTLGQGQGHGQGGKARSKEELHRRDEVKQHQRDQLEELLEQHWTPRGDTFTQPGGEGREGYSLAKEDASWSGEKTTLHGPHWVRNATRLLGTKEGLESQENAEGRKDGRLSSGNKTLSSKDIAGAGFGLQEKDKRGERGDGLPVNSTTKDGSTEGRQQGGPSHSEEKDDKDGEIQRHITQTNRPSLQADSSGLSKNQKNDSSERANQNLTEATDQRGENTFRPTKEPNPDPRVWDVAGRRRENETPEEENRPKTEEERLEEEKKELLLLHKRLDQEKERLRQQQLKREEEKEREKVVEREREREREKQREKEREGQRHHPHHKQHHHHQQTTTQITETASPTSTQPPSAPAGPRPPPRPSPPRRRMRKNRKRISKAAMRAMLM